MDVPWRWKVCFFPSARTDRPPAITSSSASQTRPGWGRITSVEWIYWLALGFSLPSSIFLCLCLHTVYYVSELMNLICWHLALSVSLNAQLMFLSTVFFSSFFSLGNSRSWKPLTHVPCHCAKLPGLWLVWMDQRNRGSSPECSPPRLPLLYLTQRWTAPSSLALQLVGMNLWRILEEMHHFCKINRFKCSA